MALLPLFGLSACANDLDGFAQRWIHPEEMRFAHGYLALLKAGQIDSAFEVLIPNLQTDVTREQLEGVARFLTEHPPDSLRLIGVQVHAGANGRFVNLSWEYRADSQWAATNVAMQHGEAAPMRVAGFGVQPLQASLHTQNEFTLAGRSLKHLLWLTLMVVVSLFCVAVAGRLALARGMPRRWLWAFVALLGVSRASLNWATGALFFQPVSVTLLGAAATKAGPAAPWVLTVAFPLGAVLALSRWWRWRSSGELQDPAVTGDLPPNTRLGAASLLAGGGGNAHDD